jgi:small-conductance mechanosensitive channel
MEIDRRFREVKIEISFPQRDLHIRSQDAPLRVSIAGGEPALESPD